MGYTSRSALALRSEPEAVAEEVQLELTRAAGARASQRQRDTWAASRGRLRDELDFLRGQSFARLVASDLRVLDRMLERIDSKLAV
jgi:hypothetical protein